MVGFSLTLDWIKLSESKKVCLQVLLKGKSLERKENLKVGTIPGSGCWKGGWNSGQTTNVHFTFDSHSGIMCPGQDCSVRTERNAHLGL